MRESWNGSPRKASSEERVLEALLDANPDRGLLREEIAQRTDIARATVTSAVAVLRDRHGVVSDGGTRGGRARDYVRVRADSGYVIGIYFSHSRVTSALGNIWGRILDKRGLDERPAQSDRSEDYVDAHPHPSLDEAAEQVRELLRHVDPSKVAGIGIAVAAPTEPGSGLIRESLGGRWDASMREWLTIDPRKELKQRLRDIKELRCAYTIGNVGNLGALPEYVSAAADWDDEEELQDMLYVAWGDGVHGGFVIQGELYCGAGLAGEVGHIPIPREGAVPQPEPCPRCGKEDCLELTISKRKIEKRAGVRLKDIDFANPNPAVLNELRHAARCLGLVLGPVLSTINPQAVVIGGPSERCYPVIIPEIHEGIKETGILPAFKDVRIRLGEHGREAPMKGAMLDALRSERVKYLLSLEHGRRPERELTALAPSAD